MYYFQEKRTTVLKYGMFLKLLCLDNISDVISNALQHYTP